MKANLSASTAISIAWFRKVEKLLPLLLCAMPLMASAQEAAPPKLTIPKVDVRKLKAAIAAADARKREAAAQKPPAEQNTLLFYRRVK